MSEFTERLFARIDALEEKVGRLSPAKIVAHTEQRLSRAMRQIEQLERIEPTPARLGTICTSAPVLAYGTFTFSASYSTGGEAFAEVDVPGLLSVVVPSVTGYTFTFNAGTAKLLAYTTADTEVVATTDLSVLGALPYYAIGQTAAERLVYRARSSVLLHSVGIVVGSAHTGTAASHWTMTVVIRTPAAARTEIGDATSFASRSLAADTFVTLYSPDTPTALAEGDTIHVELAQTGTPSHLDDLIVWVDARRRTA